MIYLTYIDGNELYGSLSIADENRLNRLISKLKDIPSFYVLVTFNILLECFPIGSSFENRQTSQKKFWQTQSIICKTLLPEFITKKFAAPEFAHRVVFSRQQLLLVIKNILRFAQRFPADGTALTQNELYFLGRICLNSSNLLVDRKQLKELENSRSLKSPDELMLELLPVFELMNPPDINRGLARTLEYLRIINEHFPLLTDNLSLNDYFKSRTGLKLESYLEFITMIYLHFFNKEVEFFYQPENFNLSRAEYFKNFSYDSAELEFFFRLVSRTFSELKIELAGEQIQGVKDYYDFTTFRKYPLVFISEKGVFTCLDIGFLLEKVTFGLYRTIHNALPDDPENPSRKETVIANELSRIWASSVEIHAGNLLSSQTGMHPNVEFKTDRSNSKQIDFIIEEQEQALIIEVKGGALSSKKYSGSFELLDEINDKFGCAQNKSGVRQLVRDIEILYNANQSERNKLRDFNCQPDFLSAIVIYPMLIVDESVFNFELLQSKLIKWFDDEISSKKSNISNQVTVNALLILTINLLEDLEPYLVNDDFTLFDFAKFYTDQVIQRAANLRYASSATFAAFRETRDIKHRNNNRMYQVFEDFMNDMGNKFKNKI